MAAVLQEYHRRTGEVDAAAVGAVNHRQVADIIPPRRYLARDMLAGNQQLFIIAVQGSLSCDADIAGIAGVQQRKAILAGIRDIAAHFACRVVKGVFIARCLYIIGEHIRRGHKGSAACDVEGVEDIVGLGADSSFVGDVVGDGPHLFPVKLLGVQPHPMI